MLDEGLSEEKAEDERRLRRQLRTLAEDLTINKVMFAESKRLLDDVG